MLESIVRQPALTEAAPVAPPRWQRHWPLIAIVLLAFFFRVHDLATIPGGLHHDEAYNGLDALRVLQGAHPIFFPDNFGREPLFLYVIALFVGLLGRTAFAIRLAAVWVAVATIPASYLLTRRLFGRPVALLATFWLATSFWHVNFMGSYQLEIGRYDAATGQRLALVPENGQPGGTRIIVGPVIV